MTTPHMIELETLNVNLLDDDLADDLIATDPDFIASIERARQQKAAGQTKTLAEIRAKYTKPEE